RRANNPVFVTPRVGPYPPAARSGAVLPAELVPSAPIGSAGTILRPRPRKRLQESAPRVVAVMTALISPFPTEGPMRLISQRTGPPPPPTPHASSTRTRRN